MDVADRELEGMIERRSRSGEVDPGEQEELWKASVRAYNARKQEEMRAAWSEHHQEQAARLRAALQDLIAHHEEAAERYRTNGVDNDGLYR